MATTNSIVYTELEDSPKFTVDDHGTRCIRQFKVPWASWPDFLDYCFGIHTCTYNNSVPQVNYVRPRICVPGWPNLFATNASVEGFDPKSPDGDGAAPNDYLRSYMNTYTAVGARVSVVFDTRFPSTAAQSHFKFSSLESTLPDGTYLTYEAEFGGEVMLTPDGTWKFSGTTIQYKGQSGLTIPSVIHTITWQPVIAPPFGLIRKNTGRVNVSEFMGVGSERLLFLGCQQTPLHRFQLGGSSNERPYYKIVYRFAEQCKQSTATDGTLLGWNYFYNKETTTSEFWQEIVDKSNNKPHRTGDFTTLFRYPTSAAEA